MRAKPGSYAAQMQQRTSDLLITGTGLVASLAVGVPVAIGSVLGDPVVTGGPAVLWWTGYLVHLGVFLALTRDSVWGLSAARMLLATQVVAGGLVVAVAPAFGFTSVLLVINAVTAAYMLEVRTVAGVVVGQSALVAVASAVGGMDPLDLALTVAVYTGFQGFAVLASLSARRASEARDALEATNAELRATTALLAESSRTNERLRIARELHDVVGHSLTALALELEVASRQAQGPAAQHVTRAQGITKDLLGDVRAAVGELRAPMPGLRTALESMATTFGDLSVHVTVLDDLPIDDASATVLLRCAQEAVTNTARHAHADNVWIDVTCDDDGVVLAARDDGRGAEVLRPGNGLRGMRERIEALGGTVELEPSAAPGFALTARVPAT